MRKKENKEKKEEKQQEVRKALSCEKCGSAYTYVLADGQLICRRCGYRNGRKEK